MLEGADESETNTVIAACVMFVAILIAWNLPILREVIAAMKVCIFCLVPVAYLMSYSAVHRRRARGVTPHDGNTLRRPSGVNLHRSK